MTDVLKLQTNDVINIISQLRICQPALTSMSPYLDSPSDPLKAPMRTLGASESNSLRTQLRNPLPMAPRVSPPPPHSSQPKQHLTSEIEGSCKIARVHLNAESRKSTSSRVCSRASTNTSRRTRFWTRRYLITPLTLFRLKTSSSSFKIRKRSVCSSQRS